MQINYKCMFCPEWHELNSWPSREIGNFARNLRNWRIDPPPPFSRDEWVKILVTELTRRSRNEKS